MKRLSEPEFDALASTLNVTPPIRGALKSCVVLGVGPAVSAREWGVSRTGLYRAYESLLRGGTTHLVRLTFEVPAQHAEALRVRIQQQLRRWSDEHVAAALRTLNDIQPERDA